MKTNIHQILSDYIRQRVQFSTYGNLVSYFILIFLLNIFRKKLIYRNKATDSSHRKKTSQNHIYNSDTPSPQYTGFIEII